MTINSVRPITESDITDEPLLLNKTTHTDEATTLQDRAISVTQDEIRLARTQSQVHSTSGSKRAVTIEVADTCLRLAIESVMREVGTATSSDPGASQWVITDEPARTGENVIYMANTHAGSCRQAVDHLIAGEIAGIGLRDRPDQLPLIVTALEERIVTIPDVVLDARKSAPSLDGRQTIVVQLLSQGVSNHYIAKRLGVSEATVKREITRLLQLFDCSSRVELAMRSQAWGYGTFQE